MNETRIRQVIENMKAEGLSQIIVSDDDALVYLLGKTPAAEERLGALFIKDDGSLDMFVNSICCFEAPAGVTLHPHQDGEDVLGALVNHADSGSLGIDKNWRAKWLVELLERRPDIKAVHGSGPVDKARACKDEDEKELLRKAGELDDKMVAFAISQVGKGMTEAQLAKAIEDQFVKAGAGPMPECQLAIYGANCAEPHHDPDHTQIKEGDAVIFDLFAPLNGYWCDMTRTVFYKKVSDEHRKVYETVKRAQQAAIDAVAPGVRLSDIDKVARDIITEAGYGEYFITRTGHGCGLTVHEAPECSRTSTDVCQVGMCFSIEPGIYIKGDVGVRIEDLVIVTEDGCEVLTKYTKELQIIE